MKYSNWLGLLGIALVVYAAFQPWIFISSKQITITGLDSAGTKFGKPAVLNLIMCAISAVLFLVPTVTAKRFNVFFAAVNLAWGLRNLILFSICQAGECPEKKIGLYLTLAASVVIMIAALFPDISLKDDDHVNR